MKHLFNNPKGHRGSAVVSLRMHEIYSILHAKLEYSKEFKGDVDALCQNFCVELEKKQGTFPNLIPLPLFQRARNYFALGGALHREIYYSWHGRLFRKLFRIKEGK